MARLHFLGTCSGTEPMAGMRYCALAIEVGDLLYWFDAGEGCSHTAYAAGLDITRTAALFISHAHIDHTGGLPNLLFVLNKVSGRYRKPLPNGNTLAVFTPDAAMLAAAREVAMGAGDVMRYTLRERGIADGPLFDDGHVRVSALHNRHLAGDGEGGAWHSFSFLIETGGKRIVFSGDVAAPEELDGLIGEGVDILIMETGHHRVADVCAYATARGVKRLYFNHHGREIIEDRAAATRQTAAFAAAHGIEITICHDGMIADI